ncbi:hypothetical protein Catovirus_1_499 [Catovirus CTV1]|uniref:Uncharacterized protein n=1 Tax=Catovirus CTV1 TaxID=1977631 RepID=A0A1V0S9S9_9VIRU|nr:hypothetical protein Catovirus_1_499 [Catovirus CTV1]
MFFSNGVDYSTFVFGYGYDDSKKLLCVNEKENIAIIISNGSCDDIGDDDFTIKKTSNFNVFKYKKLFKNNVNIHNPNQPEKYESFLFECNDDEYVYISDEEYYKFKIEEPIISFESFYAGNTPYLCGIAITENYIYELETKQCYLKSDLDEHIEDAKEDFNYDDEYDLYQTITTQYHIEAYCEMNIVSYN